MPHIMRDKDGNAMPGQLHSPTPMTPAEWREQCEEQVTIPKARLKTLEEVARAATDHMALYSSSGKPIGCCSCTLCELLRALAKLEEKP